MLILSPFNSPSLPSSVFLSSLVQVDAGLVPVGKASALDPLRVTPIAVGRGLLNSILAISMATSDKQTPHACVAGFVHV